MIQRTTILLALLVFVGNIAPLAAQGAMKVNGGNIVLSITTGLAGQQPLSVVSTATTLTYKRDNVITKITVSSSCPGQDFTLKVLATSVTAGTAAPEVTLMNGMLAANFVTDIPVKPPTTATCTLQYTASATFAQGNSAELGNDVHTITYTILAQ